MHTLFDLVGDMWHDLNGTAQILATPLFANYRCIDLARRLCGGRSWGPLVVRRVSGRRRSDESRQKDRREREAMAYVLTGWSPLALDVQRLGDVGEIRERVDI